MSQMRFRYASLEDVLHQFLVIQHSVLLLGLVVVHLEGGVKIPAHHIAVRMAGEEENFRAVAQRQFFVQHLVGGDRRLVHRLDRTDALAVRGAQNVDLVTGAVQALNEDLFGSVNLMTERTDLVRLRELRALHLAVQGGDLKRCERVGAGLCGDVISEADQRVGTHVHLVAQTDQKLVVQHHRTDRV